MNRYIRDPNQDILGQLTILSPLRISEGGASLNQWKQWCRINVKYVKDNVIFFLKTKHEHVTVHPINTIKPTKIAD